LSAQNAAQARANQNIKNLQDTYEARLAEVTSREGTFNTLAEQIRGLTSGGGRFNQGAAFNSAMQNLSAARNFGASDLATRLNFQVSDQQILDDLNQVRLGRLNNIVSAGNAQIAGIQARIDSARTLAERLPASDPRRRVADDAITSMTADLKSVTEAILGAQEKIKSYQPVTSASTEGQKEISSFREFLKLPEERSLDQIRQIDPQTFGAAQTLTGRYMDMATAPLPQTMDERTENLRGQIEDMALNELAMGSQLDSDSLRQYQQASRAAQTARGNVFGVAPAVEEAVQTGLAGEQRRLARFGAASNFLASGQTRSDAMRNDAAFRDTLLQNRLGQASNFVAGGPSLYNLATARTGQQQNAFQNYIASNMVNTGGFNPAANQVPFYQTANPNAGFMGAQTAANVYGSLADYQARTYGAYAGAQAQVASANSIPNYISAFSSLVPSLSF